MRKIVVSSLFCSVASRLSAFAQSGKELIDDAVTTGDVLGMGYSQS
jgi:hypothetical protein